MSIRGNKTCGSLSFSAGLFSLFLLAAVLLSFPAFSGAEEAKPRRPRVGLVLGGGGAKGAAHVDVIVSQG